MSKVEKLKKLEKTSLRMFPLKEKKSAMNLLKLDADDERILTAVWAKLADEKQLKPVLSVLPPETVA